MYAANTFAGGAKTLRASYFIPYVQHAPMEPRAAVAEWAAKLASKSPLIMRLGKDAMYRQQDMALDDALEFLRSQLSLTFTTEDIVALVRKLIELPVKLGLPEEAITGHADRRPAA